MLGEMVTAVDRALFQAISQGQDLLTYLQSQPKDFAVPAREALWINWADGGSHSAGGSQSSVASEGLLARAEAGDTHRLREIAELGIQLHDGDVPTTSAAMERGQKAQHKRKLKRLQDISEGKDASAPGIHRTRPIESGGPSRFQPGRSPFCSHLSHTAERCMQR
jgi:hypothetical protein